jgi:hypothetical protein
MVLRKPASPSLLSRFTVCYKSPGMSGVGIGDNQTGSVSRKRFPAMISNLVFLERNVNPQIMNPQIPNEVSTAHCAVRRKQFATLLIGCASAVAVAGFAQSRLLPAIKDRQ